MSRQPNACAGFTLLELMVVLAIVGVLIATVQLNLFRDPRQRLYAEGERLAAVLAAAGDEAVLSGRPMAVRFAPDGYTLWQRTADGAWERAQDVVYRPRALPAEVRIERVTADARRLPPGEPLVFAASGLRPVFEVRLALDDLRLSVLGDALGSIRVVEEGGR
ncbi:MAG: GspH/FimT family pseudopilin [Burkholderiales bacterium]|nr:GspH/FimT family pseudopilin [Burkholderiales bacterium]